MRVRKKGFDKFYKHSEDKFHRGGSDERNRFMGARQYC